MRHTRTWHLGKKISTWKKTPQQFPAIRGRGTSSGKKCGKKSSKKTTPKKKTGHVTKKLNLESTFRPFFFVAKNQEITYISPKN
jgi:hypothetical protein